MLCCIVKKKKNARLKYNNKNNYDNGWHLWTFTMCTILSILPLLPHNSPNMQVLLLSPFYLLGNWDLDELKKKNKTHNCTNHRQEMIESGFEQKLSDARTAILPYFPMATMNSFPFDTPVPKMGRDWKKGHSSLLVAPWMSQILSSVQLAQKRKISWIVIITIILLVLPMDATSYL